MYLKRMEIQYSLDVIQNGNSGFMDLRVGDYEGVIEFGGGDPAIQIFINQNN